MDNNYASEGDAIMTHIPNPERLAQLRAEALKIEDAMRAAIHDVLVLHKRAGQPLVTWDNGQVVLIPADQISVEDASESVSPTGVDPNASVDQI